MRLVTSILVGALFAGGSAAAQDISGGVKGGVNFANVKFDGELADVNFDNRAGLVAGGFVTWPVTPRFDIQPEALVSVKGASFEEGVVDADVELTYLEIPVLFRYRAPASGNTWIQLFAGPSLAFKLNAEVTGVFLDVSSDQDIDDEIETFDFGLVIGAGIEIGRVTLDGRYTWGLSNFNADAESPEVEVRNRVFSILVGSDFRSQISVIPRQPEEYHPPFTREAASCGTLRLQCSRSHVQAWPAAVRQANGRRSRARLRAPGSAS